MRKRKKNWLSTLIILNVLGISTCLSLNVDASWILKKGAKKQDWLTNTGEIRSSQFRIRDEKQIAGVEWQYEIQRGFSVLYMLFGSGELNGMKQISFWLKSDRPGGLVVTLTEADNSNYQIFTDFPAGEWKEFSFPVSKFAFDTDTKDENNRLDPGQIARLAIVDISGLAGKPKGSRTVMLSELTLELDAPKKTKGRGDDSIAEIYTMRIDGTELTRLTYNQYHENHVHVSPDGKKFVFTAFTKDLNRDGEVGEADMDSSEVGIMDIDGNNYKLLTNNDFADFGAVWSPDGQRVLFTTNRFGGQFDLATIKIDGSDFQRLTSTPDAWEMDPHWGKAVIVFNRWTPGKKHFPGIWKMDPDGSHEVQLTDPSFSSVSKGAPFGDMDPKISPDGKKIVFERHQNNKGNFGLGDYDLYVMDIDGRNIKDISQNSIAEAVPVWSPDSKKLVFWVVSENLEDALEIFIINSDGSDRRKITQKTDNMQKEMPSWISEDKIVFSAKVSKK